MIHFLRIRFVCICLHVKSHLSTWRLNFHFAFTCAVFQVQQLENIDDASWKQSQMIKVGLTFCTALLGVRVPSGPTIPLWSSVGSRECTGWGRFFYCCVRVRKNEYFLYWGLYKLRENADQRLGLENSMDKQWPTQRTHDTAKRVCSDAARLC